MESATAVASPARPTAPPPPAHAIRLLVSAPADGATNMATDEALLRLALRTRETLYRVYAWATPTVSLGRNQPARGRYDPDRARERGVDVVRRPTGGRAILHHREITYSVAAPVHGFGSLRESYRAVNRLLLEALGTLGVHAREAKQSGRAPVPSVAPCFEALVAGELVAGGRKLVGSAQVRDGDALLQHGSILVDDDQHILAELLGQPQSAPAPATLRELTGRAVSAQEFATALSQAVAMHYGATPDPMELDELLRHDVDVLVRTRYAVADWTWRL
ncbi:MAG: lipoate--protein ligase family protein [Gemmatimonadaceae bacterium]